MARSPVTRAQVDAYRFGLRRMDAALVSQDPVPLHEELRGQRRAVAVGVVLAMLGLAGAAIWAKLSPDPKWQNAEVIVGRQSGAMYVVSQKKRLVPVANLAAGRLVLAGLGNAKPGAEPVTVEEADLVNVARTAAAAVPGAATVWPGHGSGPEPRWAVCDTHVVRRGAGATQPVNPEPAEGTTVVAGAVAPARPLGAPDALLARSRPGEQVYLLAEGKRRKVDLADPRVTTPYELAGRTPWTVGAGLLTAMPEAPELKIPAVPDRGKPAAGGLPGRIGDVVRVVRGGSEKYYVLIAGGVQEVPFLIAELLRPADPDDPVPAVRPDLISGLERTVLDLADHPSQVPHLIEPTEASTVCWHWSAKPGEPSSQLSVSAIPLPHGAFVTGLAQADGAGPALDAAFVPAGSGPAVRAVVPGQDPATGQLWLVSSGGVAYGVADDETAKALGVEAAQPAPQGVLGLLPVGPPLDVAQARRTVDALERQTG